jgi:ornithine cyclodeaminase
VRYLDAAATRNALSMADAITAMEAAFGDDRSTPPRVLVGSSLFMPGAVGSTAGIKVVSTVPGNPVGIVVVFDADGSPLGLIDGPTLTAIRTGAGAGLATRLLARPGASTLAILGAGAMAADQVEAVRAVRPIERILVWSRTGDRAESLAARVGGIAVEHPDPAVAEADVVSTATPATEPLFSADAIRPGTHINAVGAFTPDMCEIPGELVRRAFVVVDDREAAALEAGDLLRVGRSPDATVADLLEGRMHPPDGDVTFFKSVGISSQDVAAGRAALLNAERLGLGTVID